MLYLLTITNKKQLMIRWSTLQRVNILICSRSVHAFNKPGTLFSCLLSQDIMGSQDIMVFSRRKKKTIIQKVVIFPMIKQLYTSVLNGYPKPWMLAKGGSLTLCSFNIIGAGLAVANNPFDLLHNLHNLAKLHLITHMQIYKAWGLLRTHHKIVPRASYAMLRTDSWELNRLHWCFLHPFISFYTDRAEIAITGVIPHTGRTRARRWEMKHK